MFYCCLHDNKMYIILTVSGMGCCCCKCDEDSLPDEESQVAYGDEADDFDLQEDYRIPIQCTEQNVARRFYYYRMYASYIEIVVIIIVCIASCKFINTPLQLNSYGLHMATTTGKESISNGLGVCIENSIGFLLLLMSNRHDSDICRCSII